MDSVDLVPLIEQLDDNIDDLEEALSPLLKGALSDTAGTLPLLDKAQLYVLTTYAIESVVFSFLRLNGINAKEHPVFRELTRVKQYFEKISLAESRNSKRETTLDKPAAGRFIKHALAGNDKYDLKRAQQQLEEKARAHIRFEHLPVKRKRENEGTPAPDPNSQLVGAASSQSSSSPSVSSPQASQNEGLITTASKVSPDTDPTHGVSGQEHRDQAAEPLSKEERKPRKKRGKRGDGTLSRFNPIETGPEEPIIPGKSSNVPAPGSNPSPGLMVGAAPNAEPKQKKGRRSHQAKRAAKEAAE